MWTLPVSKQTGSSRWSRFGGCISFFFSFKFQMSPHFLLCSPQHQGATETRQRAQISAVMMVTVTKVFHSSFTPPPYDQTLPGTCAWQQISQFTVPIWPSTYPPSCSPSTAFKVLTKTFPPFSLEPIDTVRSE